MIKLNPPQAQNAFPPYRLNTTNTDFAGKTGRWEYFVSRRDLAESHFSKHGCSVAKNPAETKNPGIVLPGAFTVIEANNVRQRFYKK